MSSGVVEKKVSESSKIICPHCGKQYWFEDIFIPDAVHHDGDCIEQFICDDTYDKEGRLISKGCGKSFEVKVRLIYMVSPLPEDTFEEETVINTVPEKPKLILSFE